MKIHIWNSIQSKGYPEGIYQIVLFIWKRLYQMVSLTFYNVRGYNIDMSVILLGRIRIFQSRKGSIRIGGQSEFGEDVTILAGYKGKIHIGNHVGIYDFSYIDIHETLTIGDDTLIAPFCFIVDYDHKTSNTKERIHEQGYVSKPIRIGSRVWIGAHTTILKGVTIGDNAVIGAGSVVTRDIPAKSIAYGNPARVVKKKS